MIFFLWSEDFSVVRCIHFKPPGQQLSLKEMIFAEATSAVLSHRHMKGMLESSLSLQYEKSHLPNALCTTSFPITSASSLMVHFLFYIFFCTCPMISTFPDLKQHLFPLMHPMTLDYILSYIFLQIFHGSCLSKITRFPKG